MCHVCVSHFYFRERKHHVEILFFMETLGMLEKYQKKIDIDHAHGHAIKSNIGFLLVIYISDLLCMVILTYLYIKNALQ